MKFKCSIAVVFVFFILLSLFSCKQKTNSTENTTTSHPEVQNNKYHSEEIGWTISIPENWEIVAKDQLENADKIGEHLIKENTNVEVDASQLKHLISFRKDELNIFAATAEPFEASYENEYAENNKLINMLIYNTFTNQGIQVDSSSGMSKIGTQEFYQFTNKIYDPEGNLFLTQTLYSQQINGYDFAINLAYDNEEDKAVMLSALENSVFE